MKLFLKSCPIFPSARNGKRQVWSLNKTIVGIILVGYAAFLGVLMIATGYLIANYQSGVQKENVEILNEYMKTAESELKEVNDDIYNIYSNNTNFKKLLSDKEELQQFGDVYEIYQELRNKAVLSSAMDGFLIFYDNMKKSRYYLPTEYNGCLYTSEQTELLHTKVKSIVQSGEANRVWWTVIGHGDGASIAIICKKNNAAVCGVYNMDKIRYQIEERMGENAEVYLLDDMNFYTESEENAELDIKSCIDWEEMQFQKYEGKYKLYGQQVKNTGLWFVMVLRRGWRDYFAEFQLLMILLTVISLCAVIFVLKFIRSQFVRPIVELTEVMKQIRNGSWEVGTLAEYNCREINDITETFRSMLEEIKRQKIQVYEETIEKQRAEMLYLQLQLKPHFFLNCLKTLNVMVMEADSVKAQNFIMNISDYLRYLLQSEKELVTVSEELRFVRNYIEMQKNMTGRPVEAEFIIEDEAKELLVPVLCIHTFVENSVKHAKLTTVGMSLDLKAEVHLLKTEEKNYLDIIVSDNGEGYPQEILEEINGDIQKGKRNVGINNLKRRCRLLYKGEEEYIFDNQGGAYSELIIPERG